MNEGDRVEELNDKRQAYQDLQRSLGWKMLRDLAEAQVEQRKVQELAYDITCSEDLFELAKLKAERRALILFLSLPETLVETLTEEIEEELDEPTS